MVSDCQCVTSTHVAPSRKASDESTLIRNSGDAYAERATIPTPGSAVFSHIDESLPCIPDCSCPYVCLIKNRNHFSRDRLTRWLML